MLTVRGRAPSGGDCPRDARRRSGLGVHPGRRSCVTLAPCRGASVETVPAREEQLCAWRRGSLGERPQPAGLGVERRDALCSVVAQLPSRPTRRPHGRQTPGSSVPHSPGAAQTLVLRDSSAVRLSGEPRVLVCKPLAQRPHLVLSSLWPSGPPHQHRRLQAQCLCEPLTDVCVHRRPHTLSRAVLPGLRGGGRSESCDCKGSLVSDLTPGNLKYFLYDSLS